MTAPVRLAAFAGVLAAVLLAGLGVGRAVGPLDEPAPASHGSADGSGHGSGHSSGHSDDGAAHGSGHGDGDGAHAADGEPSGVTGLAVAEGGYALRVDETVRPVGTAPFRFTVDGPDGAPVTDYDVTHERELHLVVVRRDGTGFQHLHPTRTGDGTWLTPLTLDRPGAYRAYADFAPAGEPARTLAVDLLVPGAADLAAWPAPATTTTVDDLEVRLEGHLDAGQESELAFTVTRDGRPVELEPYLGALGHLVVLREGDLGYLHVHAEQGDLSFAATAPTEGRYRLFLQVSVDGVVRTVDLTTDTGGHA